MASRCDYYSDEEYQQACAYEEQNMYDLQNVKKEEDIYNNLISTLHEVGIQLGIDHAISYLEHLKKGDA